MNGNVRVLHALESILYEAYFSALRVDRRSGRKESSSFAPMSAPCRNELPKYMAHLSIVKQSPSELCCALAGEENNLRCTEKIATR